VYAARTVFAWHFGRRTHAGSRAALSHPWVDTGPGGPDVGSTGKLAQSAREAVDRRVEAVMPRPVVRSVGVVAGGCPRERNGQLIMW
jgi:hypothetical protein